MYNRNINRLTAVIQSPIAPRSTNVLWDDLVSNTLKVYRKGIWTVIGGAGGGGEGSSLYWGYDEIQGVIFPLDNRSVQINGDLTVNGTIKTFGLEINGKPFEQYWELDSNTNTLSTTYQVLIKNSLIVEQDASSGGDGQDTPSAGLDEEQLQDYLDLHKYVTEDDIAGLIPDVDLSSYYTKGESDARYLALSGGTMTGDLSLNQYLRINAWAGYGSGSANAWYNGNTQMLLWDNVSGIGLGSNVVIHSGNIGSQWVDVANSLTNILIPSDLTTIGPKTINWFDWAQSTGQGIASYSYGIWTGSPDINYGFGFGADAFDDELYFKLMRGGTVGPWRRVIATADDGYLYGLGGSIDIQYDDEINRYGGNLHLQHRGGSGAAGSGTGGTTTGHILMCAYGGNVLIGTAVDDGYKLDVTGDSRINGALRVQRLYDTNSYLDIVASDVSVSYNAYDNSDGWCVQYFRCQDKTIMSLAADGANINGNLVVSGDVASA